MKSQSIQEYSVKKFLGEHCFDKALIVFSPTSVEKADLQQEIQTLEDHALSSTNIDYESLTSAFDGYSTYIGFGGGTAIDAAKFLSCRNPASTCIAIPSMLSTNVFATNKTAAVYKGYKKTVDSKLPDKIILDYGLLEKSMRENIFGLVDAFSIHTAMRDWLIANRKIAEPVGYRYLGWDTFILYKAQEIAKKIALRFPGNRVIIEEIFSVLIQAGYITNDWGCGRPESGSEHIVAKYIEELVSVPHAVAVTCGIAIVSQLQENKAATNELKQLGMFETVRNSKVTKEVLIQALQNVKPRKDRYTVIDLMVGYDGYLNADLINQLVQNSGLYD